MRASGQLNEWRRLRAAQLPPPMVQPVDRWNPARAFRPVSQRRFKEHMAQTHTSAPVVRTPPQTAVTEYGIFWELWPQFVGTGSDSQLAVACRSEFITEDAAGQCC
jgi:hypothetical protein